MTAITVRDVFVELDRTPILHGVSCAIRRGGWLGLIGPNGAGKSTLLRAIAGLLPYRGEVLLDETDTGSLGARDRARLIAYVPQEPLLPPDMLVSDYVLLGRTPYLSYLGGPGRADREAAEWAAERLDVARFTGRRLASLSGGERERVVLARALAQEPSVLLLDEPTAFLDIGHQQQVLDLIDGLRVSGGMTVLSTLHDLTTAAQYAEHLVLLHEGKIDAAGEARDILTAERIARVYNARVSVRDGAVIPVRTTYP
jgi:iron complex transport system ATP-binding protein